MSTSTGVTVVKVSIKELLAASGVELTAELNGRVEDALKELRSPDCDLAWVACLLRPVLFIRLPGLDHKYQVQMEGDKAVFHCSPTLLKYLVGYFSKMDWTYTWEVAKS